MASAVKIELSQVDRSLTDVRLPARYREPAYAFDGYRRRRIDQESQAVEVPERAPQLGILRWVLLRLGAKGDVSVGSL